MWDLIAPQPGEVLTTALKGEVLTTGPPGKSPDFIFSWKKKTVLNDNIAVAVVILWAQIEFF